VQICKSTYSTEKLQPILTLSSTNTQLRMLSAMVKPHLATSTTCKWKIFIQVLSQTPPKSACQEGKFSTTQIHKFCI